MFLIKWPASDCVSVSFQEHFEVEYYGDFYGKDVSTLYISYPKVTFHYGLQYIQITDSVFLKTARNRRKINGV